ncbi:MAG: AAA family ATPase [Brevinema sp.]
MEKRIVAIQTYLEESGESQAKLSHRSGLSPTVVNQVLKGTYKGNVNICLSKIEEAIQHSKDREAVTFKAPESIGTSRTKKVFRALSEAQAVSIPRILVLYGDSGIGKTHTITEYVEDNSTATVIEIRPDFTIKAVLQTIAQEIGVSHLGSNFDVTNRIISKLKGSNRMLIFDEAEYLSARSLDIIRRIYDKAQIPIVLVGMPNLFHNIKSLRKGFEQIANRMVSYNLGTPKKEDLEKIITNCIPNAEQNIISALTECSKGTIRTLILLMQDLVNYSADSGKKITSKDVHDFVNSMH